MVAVHTGSLAGGGVGQTVLGAHGTATAVPPLHEVVVWLWQTMPWPQSVAQVCALTSLGMARTATRAMIHKRGFVGVMVASFDRVECFHSLAQHATYQLAGRSKQADFLQFQVLVIQNSDGPRIKKSPCSKRDMK